MIELVIPTPEDFRSLAAMKDLAFVEKRGCLSNSAKNISENVKLYETYAKKHPSKIQHCRIVKDNTDGTVIGACQLHLQGDMGDLSFPAFARHPLVQGEAYVEWIACHPNHTGKGIGSKLLQWAEQFAKEQGNARMLTLEVMKKNDGAMRLYERKGFVWKKGSNDPHYESGDWFFGGLFIFCCLGCQYWTVCYMEKDLGSRGHLGPPSLDISMEDEEVTAITEEEPSVNNQESSSSAQAFEFQLTSLFGT